MLLCINLATISTPVIARRESQLVSLPFRPLSLAVRVRGGGVKNEQHKGTGKGIATNAPKATASSNTGNSSVSGKPKGAAAVIDSGLSANLRPRESYHLSRKAFHLSTISLIAMGYSSMPVTRRKTALCTVAGLELCAIILEITRLQNPAINKFAVKAMGPFMRQHEVEKFSGIVYCFLGLLVTAAIFPKHIALIGMLQLALGDPIAALVGHGTRQYRWARLSTNKSYLGTLAASVALSLLNCHLLFKADWGLIRPESEVLVLAGIMIAALSSVAELCIPTPQLTCANKKFPVALDDNFVLPILGAAAAQFTFWLLKLPLCAHPKRLFWSTNEGPLLV